MTEDNVIKAIALAVKGDTANRNEIAGIYLQKAILRLGRMNDVSYNMDMVTFSTTASQNRYSIGSDIITNQSGVWNIKELYRTDEERFRVPIVGTEDFFDYAAGSDDTGEPQLATIHSSDSILEFWPTPDSAYPFEAYIRKQITNFEDIPGEYHDVLIDIATESVSAAYDPNMAAKKAKEGMDDIRDDSQTKWTGNKIILARHLGDNTGVSGRVDSGNLRGA